MCTSNIRMQHLHKWVVGTTVVDDDLYIEWPDATMYGFETFRLMTHFLDNELSWNADIKTNMLWMNTVKQFANWTRGEKLYVNVDWWQSSYICRVGRDVCDFYTCTFIISANGFIYKRRAAIEDITPHIPYDTWFHKYYEMANCVYNDIRYHIYSASSLSTASSSSSSSSAIQVA